ncbi:N-acyl-D-amino-acid deacylase family protein [Pseudonocardia nigra]|uniref:N-acyl-D-amino-acid deacylase family protein n=1 Tax=Pseudonocardia nigra TaxID=1921578 RepID=UPI001C6069E9|nr:amidohydrolase family protein [Pseudonocardia nigra]
MVDLVLRNGWVVDGSGCPPMRADVAVTGDRISAVERVPEGAGREELDVRGCLLLPGLIDTHVHGDALLGDPAVQEAALRQGVTTFVLGQDGVSFAPSDAATAAYAGEYFAAINGPTPAELRGGVSLAELLAWYDGASALNAAYLVPHGTVRHRVLRDAERPPDAEELAAMCRLVEDALADGAAGLSTGLDYLPGRHADAEEIAALCAPVAAAGVPYVTHMRGYEALAHVGMAEVERITALSGVAAHISHYHGPANMLVGLVDAARDRGVDLTFDSYPYRRGCSLLAMLALPPQVQGSVGDTLARLADPLVRTRLDQEWFPAVADTLARLTLAHVPSQRYGWAEGMTLPEAAAEAGTSVGELVCVLLVETGLATGAIVEQPAINTDADVRALLRHPAHMGSSDGIYLGGHPHPRGWGAFARMLGRHTRELGDWSWAEAAVHLAGHPARRFGLADRGRLVRGAAADVVVLEPDDVIDRAGYDDPRRPATGVRHVLVNGAWAVRDEALTGARPGRALRP